MVEVLAKDMLTIAQAARLMGVNYQAMQKYLKRHSEIQTYRIGRVIVVPRSALVEYVPVMK